MTISVGKAMPNRIPLEDGHFAKLDQAAQTMKGFYNSHIIKYKDVLWARDHPQLVSVIENCNGGELVVRVEQASRGKRSLDLGASGLQSALEVASIHLDKPFSAEVIIRNPSGIKTAKVATADEEDLEDRNDWNCLHWGGKRGEARVPEHPHRHAPMFFRDNGMNVDLVDLYRGQSVFLILNGPSFAEVDHDLLRQPGVMTFGINNGAHVFRPDFWTCVDDPTRFMASIWKDPCIQKFVPMAHFLKPIWSNENNAVTREKVRDFPNVLGFRRNENFRAGQFLTEHTINWGNHKKRGGGRSVMLSALRICHLLGFRRVYLLGCDFRMNADEKYWFDEQRSKQAIRNNANSYAIMRRYFTELLPHFEAASFEVFNCTADSDLTVFPALSLDEALAEATGDIDTEISTRGMYTNRF